LHVPAAAATLAPSNVPSSHRAAAAGDEETMAVPAMYQIAPRPAPVAADWPGDAEL